MYLVRSGFEPWVERVSLGFADAEFLRFRMKRIQEEISGARNDCAWDCEEDPLGGLQPSCSNLASGSRLKLPMLWKIGDGDSRNGDIRTLDSQQSEARGNIIRSGVDANFQQCRGWAITEVHNRLPGEVPTSARLEASGSVQVPMAADAPKNHLNVDALIDLNQKFFDDSATRICFQQRQGRPILQPCIWFA